MLDIIHSLLRLFFSLYNCLINNFGIGNLHNNIFKLFGHYWIAFLLFWIIIIAWYLFISFAEYAIIYNIYSRIREISPLGLMTRIAEGYYLLDKLCNKLTPKSIKTYMDTRNEFRKFRDFGPISIYGFIKSLLIQPFKLSKFNILVWLTMFIYFQPSVIQNSQAFVSTIKWTQISSIFSFIKLGDIKKFYDDINILYLIPATFINGFIFYQKYTQVTQSDEEEKFKRALLYQEKLEKHFSNILVKIEENIVRFSKQIEFLPDLFCRFMTNNTYSIYKNKLEKSEYPRFKNDSIEEYVKKYESFKTEIDAIIETLNAINSEGVYSYFRSLNKSAKYEYFKIGLFYRPIFKTNIHDYLEQQDIKKFFESSTDEDYLKERFSYINKVNAGYMSKKQVEDEYGEFYRISYDKMQKFAEEDLERKAIIFAKDAKSLLADAILAHIHIECYLKNVYNKRRGNVFLVFLRKLSKFFSKK